MVTVDELRAQIDVLQNQLQHLQSETKVKRKKVLIKLIFGLAVFLGIAIYQTYWPARWISSLLNILDNYLRLIIVSWPIIILIIFIFLLIRHREAIDYFIRYRLKSVGPQGVDSHPDSEKQKGESIGFESTGGSGQNNNRETELFVLLNAFLVANTKNALHWFFQQNSSVDVNVFNNGFIVNLPKDADAPREKLVIFSVLIQFELIEPDNNKSYKISDRGKKFLKYIGRI